MHWRHAQPLSALAKQKKESLFLKHLHSWGVNIGKYEAHLNWLCSQLAWPGIGKHSP